MDIAPAYRATSQNKEHRRNIVDILKLRLSKRHRNRSEPGAVLDYKYYRQRLCRLRRHERGKHGHRKVRSLLLRFISAVPLHRANRPSCAANRIVHRTARFTRQRRSAFGPRTQRGTGTGRAAEPARTDQTGQPAFVERFGVHVPADPGQCAVAGHA